MLTNQDSFHRALESLDIRLRGVRVLVVGDVMLDRYIEGAVRRISPEAPVPIVSLRREWDCPGGAGNVAASIAGLGAEVTLAAVIGSDEAGRRLRARLTESGVESLVLIDRDGLQTVTKTRVLSGNHHQLMRLDIDGNKADYELTSNELIALVVPLVRAHDIVCIADYDKGTLSASVLRAIIDEAKKHEIPCLVDPKKIDFSDYARATVITPNLFETERMLGRPLATDADVNAAAVELCIQLQLSYLLITRGADGMTLADPTGVRHFPALVREIADVAGAGDTVVAALACALAAGWEVGDGCRLASVAAGLAVSKPGVYVVRALELNRAWMGKSPKVLDREAAHDYVREAKRLGRKVVFTNGCFDILHAGHLCCLEAARRHGDLLVVGLNSDASVKLNKGESRPIIDESHRAALLAGLACVDAVVLFDELTPEKLIIALEPDVLVKGGDYDPDTIAGAKFVRERGGSVITVPVLKGFSTTAILEGVTAGRG